MKSAQAPILLHWPSSDSLFQHFSHKYTLTDRCIGKGAEGAVYLTRVVSTGKQIVCKLVNLDKLGNNGCEEVRRKFQEADILRQLQHVSAVRFGVS